MVPVPQFPTAFGPSEKSVPQLLGGVGRRWLAAYPEGPTGFGGGNLLVGVPRIRSRSTPTLAEKSSVATTASVGSWSLRMRGELTRWPLVVSNYRCGGGLVL